MGNRSYLYLVSSATPTDGFIEIAEANNNFPVLWKILLAGGDAVPAIDYQRVFGDNDTDNLASDAETGLARIRALGAVIRQHPLLGKLPGVEHQFEGLELFLVEQIAAAGEDGAEGRVLLSANLDQLSWLDGSQSPEQFIHQCRRECDDCWAEVEAALQARNFPALDEALGLTEYGSGFGDWTTWAWSFGFGGLHHDYFSSHEPPRLERFADFVPESSAEDGFEYGCRRLEHEGGVGLQQRDDAGDWKTVIAPEWEDVAFATYGAVWVLRNGLWGYMRFADGVAELRLAPQIDEFEVFFGETGDSCAIVSRGGRQGFLRSDGSWLFEPAVDEVWRFENGYAAFRQGKQEGFIDATGRIAIPACYDWVGVFSPDGVAPVNLGDGYGLVRGDGEVILALAYEHIEWHEVMSAFEITRGGRKGLWHGDGRPWLAIEWDAFKPLVTDRLLGVSRDKLWGVCDWSGQLRIEPRYQQLEVREIVDFAEETAAAAPCQLLARQAGKLGVVDDAGQILMPFEYQHCEAFDALTEDARRLPGSEGLLRVARKGARKQLKFGVYDLARQCEIVACQYDHIYILETVGGDFCFVVANDNPKAEQARLGKRRVGMLRRDGTPLFGLDYAWLCSPRDLDDNWSRAIVGQQLRQRWAAALPIQSVRSESGLYAWLTADGKELAHAEHLAQRFAAGDLASALMLGRHYRDGEGIDADPEAARCWLARAAGLPDSVAGDPQKLLMPPPSPSSPGVVRRLLGRLSGRRPAADSPLIAQAGGLYEAMLDLSKMLQTGEGGPASPGAARFWLEMAARSGGEENRDVRSLLGYFLCNGIGGAADTQRGIELYRRAAEQKSNQACYNLAIIHEWGQGVEADQAVALEYYRQSERLGDPDAAYAIGRLLRAQAGQLEGRARRKQLGEAAYFLTRALDDDNCEFVGPACLELALIRLDPEAPESYDEGAETLLLRGAELGNVDCIKLLLEKFYALEGGPRQDAERCRTWQARLAELQTACGE